jgi:hypothetical protein
MGLGMKDSRADPDVNLVFCKKNTLAHTHIIYHTIITNIINYRNEK